MRETLREEDRRQIFHELPCATGLSLATAVVAPEHTTVMMPVEVGSVPGASPVANGTSISAVDIASAAVANGRLPAAVPLTVSLSAACGTRHACFAYHTLLKMRSVSYTLKVI